MMTMSCLNAGGTSLGRREPGVLDGRVMFPSSSRGRAGRACESRTLRSSSCSVAFWSQGFWFLTEPGPEPGPAHLLSGRPCCLSCVSAASGGGVQPWACPPSQPRSVTQV